MPSENTEQRKLAAIMFTDMVGYSALSQRNEALTRTGETNGSDPLPGEAEVSGSGWRRELKKEGRSLIGISRDPAR